MEPDHTLPQEIQPQTDKFISQANISKDSDGWLASDGSFYKCTSTQHDECADFLVDRYDTYNPDNDVPSRLKLEEIGFVLVRGSVIPNFNLNLTPVQINMLDEAKITIINPDTNTECDPSISEKIINQLRTKMSIFEDQKELLKKHDRWEGWSGIEEFSLSPLTNFLINVTDDINNSGINATNFVFDTLSSGWSEEVEIDVDYKHPDRADQRNQFYIRLTPITDTNDLLLVTVKYIYLHDGLSEGLTPNQRHLIYTRIETKSGIQLKGIIGTNLQKDKNKDIAIKFTKDKSPILTSIIDQVNQTDQSFVI